MTARRPIARATPLQDPAAEIRAELARARQADLDALTDRFPGMHLLDRDAAIPVGAVLRAPERLPVALR